MVGKYVLQNPGKTAVMFLAVVGAETQHSFPKPATLLQKNEDYTKPCFPEDKLFIDYNIMANVNELHEARYFIAGELHYSLAHHRLKSHFASTLLTKGDRLLFEAVAEHQLFPCQDICLYQDNKTYFLYNSSKQKDGMHPKCGLYFNFDKTLQCGSWEDLETHTATGKMLAMLENAGKIIEFSRNELNQLKSTTQRVITKASSGGYTKNTDVLQDAIALYNKMLAVKQNLDRTNALLIQLDPLLPANKANFSLLKNQIMLFKEEENNGASLLQTMTAQFRLLSEDSNALMSRWETLASQSSHMTIAMRNKGFIKKFGFFAENNKSEKTGIFMGMNHILNTNITSSEVTLETAEQDNQYELRKKLEEFPHAILIPKDFTIRKSRL
jgi:hypothetical protein